VRLVLLLVLLMPLPALANPCTDTQVAGNRISVTPGCARACASAVAVQVPALRADLVLCKATAGADLKHAHAALAACERQVQQQRLLLDRAVQQPQAPHWWQSRWLAGGAGAVIGGAAVWLLLDSRR